MQGRSKWLALPKLGIGSPRTAGEGLRCDKVEQGMSWTPDQSQKLTRTGAEQQEMWNAPPADALSVCMLGRPKAAL